MKKKPSGMDWFCVLSVLDVGVSSHVNECREGRRGGGCWEKPVKKNGFERGSARPRQSEVKRKGIAKRGDLWFDKWAEWSTGKREVLAYFYIPPCGSPCSLDLSIIMTETPKLTCFFSPLTPFSCFRSILQLSVFLHILLLSQGRLL